MSSAAAKIAENNLPKILAVVFRAGGWLAVHGLVKTMGGKRIRVPRMKVGDHHPLVAAAGRAAADIIVEIYGDKRNVEIPRGGHSLKLMLVRENASLSDNELARLMGCTYRHASNLRKEAQAGGSGLRGKRGRRPAPRDPRQIDLEDLLK